MAALTKAYEAFEKPAILVLYKMAGNTTIYKGALVGVNNAGYAVPIDHAVANLTFIGIAQETVQNTGADGDKSIRVVKSGSGVFADLGIQSQSNIGKEVYAKTDNEVQVATTGLTNLYKVGRIVALETTSLGANGYRIRIDGYAN